MKITSIFIKNYRSLKNESIRTMTISNQTCFIFLGINESGKSNLLSAISLLNKEAEFNYARDCNKDLEDQSILVKYSLAFDNLSFYQKYFGENGLPKELAQKITFSSVNRVVEIESNNQRKDYLEAHVRDIKELNSYIIDDQGVRPRTPENYAESEDGTTNLLDQDKLNNYIESKFFQVFDRNTPEALVWRSESKYLISQPINLDEFKNDTGISIPLKNVFTISKIYNIKAKIESISSNPAKSAELADKLGKSVTKHINTVWKEHKVKIKIWIDNMMLSFLVEDKDYDDPKYEVNQRSDGFKHFISILLNLSVENERGELKNKIILLDEPEVHLHPSGQKYLRDELLNISENNLVFYATHSIYMVDTNRLERHFSIIKNIGITEIHQVESDNPYKEEVLYEALGTSVLAHIMNDVLILEGKLDRDLFDLYSRKFKQKKEISTARATAISADGVENVIKYTKFFNTNLIKGYVLVDSDKDGINMKKKVLAEKGYNKRNVFTLNDLLDLEKESTIEDFFDKKILEAVVSELWSLSIGLNVKEPYIEQIKNMLQKSQKPYRKEEKKKLRENVFLKISKFTKGELRNQRFYMLMKNIDKVIK